MRIPLTPLGGGQLVAFGFVPLALGLGLGFGVHWGAGLPFLLIALFSLNFFRDPERAVPSGEGLLVSAADGKVVNVLEVDEPLYLKGRGLRIGVFLNVFNVHVNRAPGAGVVELVDYRPGKFLDARDPRISEENEANAIGLRLDDGRRVLIRQVAGLIARRIVCTAKVGDRVERGERIGMIKFGSYTEVIVEPEGRWEPAVKVGEKVNGASTVLLRTAE
ncbi:MAG: phosphatidylserine decarboxylase [Planctomycetota bacterium JB042]